MRQAVLVVESSMTPDENRAFFKRFGKRLAAFRKQCGLTQAQVGELIGYSQTQVASFETGRRRIPVSVLPTLVKAFGISFEDLMGEGENRGRPGPKPRLQSQLERLSKLPRSKQKLVAEMLDGILAQAS